MNEQPQKKTMVVGIVGGVACGKSQVTQMLGKMGASVISADKIAHHVLCLPDIVEALIQAFGVGILTDSSAGTARSEPTIDRKKLGALVFGSRIDSNASQRRKLLESIVHPRIREIAKSQLESMQALPSVNTIVLDAPLLIEGGWLPFCDKVIYVDAPDELREAWAVRRGWSAEEFRNRESAQMSLADKKKKATDVLQNVSDLNHLRIGLAQILDNWRGK